MRRIFRYPLMGLAYVLDGPWGSAWQTIVYRWGWS